ncbi:MAG: DNA repair protein RecO [Calothrix sp. SM1_7_51]|nr:DNA repair protein RecO [Calothrix sp. SM1_7_51]
MSKTYKAIGINLKATAFGESDRLVTVLTREFGLVRAIAPGARKHNSSLGGRSGMFVVNDLLIAKGRSLDKITQAQTIKTYPGLAKDLSKLAASQYIAEIALSQALSEQPQEELFELLNEHLQRLEELTIKGNFSVLAYLSQAVFHLLALAGLTPQVQLCCLTQRAIIPDISNPDWCVGFSITSGGTVCLTEWERLKKESEKARSRDIEQENHDSFLNDSRPITSFPTIAKEQSSDYQADYQTIVHRQELPTINSRLNAKELAMFQLLCEPEIMFSDKASESSWLSVEYILRQYAQYHLGHPIRSAALIDSYFAVNQL